jgi:hypothetical protein
MTNNVKFRLLVGYDSLDDECLLTMPEDITVRIGDIRSSRIIIDSVSMILMDSKNGKAALFNSLDVIGVSYIRHFEEDWANASQVNLSKNTDMALAMKATKLVKVMKEFLYSQPFVQSFDSPSDDPRSILNILERNGVKSLGENPEEIVRIIDHSLKLTSYGTIKYDKNNSGIIMRCLVEKRKIFPWAMLLCLSMDQKGCKSKIIQNLDSLEDVIYIKLAKPIP